MAKPSELPEWASSLQDPADIVVPPASRKLTGWHRNAGVPEKPPYQYFNWWQNKVYQWIVWFDSLLDQGVKRSDIPTFAAIFVGTSEVTNSVDPMVNVNRVCITAGNSHCFSDSSTYNKPANTAFASFDARCVVSGSVNYDHYAAFQSGPSTHNYTGTIKDLFCFISVPTIDGSAIVTNRYGMYVASPAGTGVITNNYGLYIEQQHKGTNNYAIYSADITSSSVLKGPTLEIGDYSLHAVTLFKIKGCSAGGFPLFCSMGVYDTGYFSISVQGVADAIKIDTVSGVVQIGASGSTETHRVNGSLQVTLRAANSSNVAAYFTSTGILSAVSSSRTTKKNIEDLTSGLDLVKQMRPVEFDYISEENPQRKMIGLIAEELEEVCPNMVVHDEQGQPASIFYQDLPIVLLKAMKDQQKIIEDLQSQIDVLMAKVSALL